MTTFGSGLSAASTAVVATRDATTRARAALGNTTPKLAIVFASPSYADVDRVAGAVAEVIGPVPIVGGTSGSCVFGGDECARIGVSVVLLGGDDVEVDTRIIPVGSQLIGAVPATEELARAADAAARRGFGHYACLAFGPGVVVDGEEFVAAIRKGAGARAQLAGGLTGDDFTMDRSRVFASGELRADRVVVTGLYTKRPIGVAARHGWQPAGSVREVTRAEGNVLIELDGRNASDVWLDDLRATGANPPSDPKARAAYLSNNYGIGIVDGVRPPREAIARAVFAVADDGSIRLSGSIAAGTHVRALQCLRGDFLRASSEAAGAAVTDAGGSVAGALVLACSGRLMALGESYPEEPAAIRRRVGAPIGGACVYGEIARNVRDVDAFFNTTAVVVAFAA